MLDISLIPLNFLNGQEQPGLPGLYGATAPKHTARGRSGDQIALLLSLLGKAPFSLEGLRKLLDHLAQTYFNTAGSVTNALRAAAEELNQYLLERNLHSTSTGRQAVGLLNMVAVHGSRLVMIQCGPTHAFLLTSQGMEHYYEDQLAGRGLGLSRTLTARFHQVEIAPGDYLVMSPEPPASWDKILTGSAGVTLDELRRRLLIQAQPNLSAAILQIQAGNGKVELVRPVLRETIPVMPVSGDLVIPPLSETRTPESRPLSDQPAPARPQALFEEASLAQETIASPTILPAAGQSTIAETPPSPPSAPPVQVKIPPKPQPVLRQAEPVQKDQPESAPEAVEEVKSARKSTQAINWRAGLRPLAAAWHAVGKARQRLGGAIKETLGRLLPGGTDQIPSFSPGTMLFIAIAVPVVIVAAALVVYYEKGRAEQYQLYFAQAQTAANEALTQNDPEPLRLAWQRALILLDKADSFQETTESRNLRKQAQGALDQMDFVQRLDFKPAIVGGLDKAVIVSRIVMAFNDLYLLDSSQGRVLRAILTGRGYEIDTKFTCGPGQFGGIIVSPLIDFAPMQIGNLFKAAIMALDGEGNLVYCLSSGAPTAAALAAPDNNWGKISTFAVDADRLYVLDSKANTLWYYEKNEGDFRANPSMVFETNAPKLDDVIDLAVNAQDLYLLHSDGHLTLCSFSQVQDIPTRCSDPVNFADPRPGRERTPITFPEARFSQFLLTQPPDPSIYMLDEGAGTIYHFSLRLNLQRLLLPQPDSTLGMTGQNATAFTMGANRSAFLAIDNQVYYAFIP